MKACVCTQVGFPPFLSIVSRLNQVNNLIYTFSFNTEPVQQSDYVSLSVSPVHSADGVGNSNQLV